MKKLLLLLPLAFNLAAMQQDLNYDSNSLEEISLKAAPLHEFFTENLDNTAVGLDQNAIAALAEALENNNVNPAILLQLEDKRTKRDYDFELYLKENKNKSLVVNSKNPYSILLSSRMRTNGKYNLPDGLQIATIDLCQASNDNNDLLQNGATIVSFDLVNNGEDKKSDSSYSLIHLLLCCKRLQKTWCTARIIR